MSKIPSEQAALPSSLLRDIGIYRDSLTDPIVAAGLQALGDDNPDGQAVFHARMLDGRYQTPRRERMMTARGVAGVLGQLAATQGIETDVRIVDVVSARRLLLGPKNAVEQLVEPGWLVIGSRGNPGPRTPEQSDSWQGKKASGVALFPKLGLQEFVAEAAAPDKPIVVTRKIGRWPTRDLVSLSNVPNQLLTGLDRTRVYHAVVAFASKLLPDDMQPRG